MTMRRVLILTLVMAGASLALMFGLRRLNTAEARLASAEAALQATEEDARQVLALRAARQHVAAAEQPKQDVISRVNTALATAGLPLGAFQGLQPESDVALNGDAHTADDGPEYRKQSLRLSLADVSPGELGRFLSAWTEQEPLWAITRVDLAHERGRGRGENLYDVTLVLSAIYVDQR